MTDLTSKYMGLKLRNPIIIASSGLTENVSGLKELEKFGAGAVILKSLFEEEILIELKHQKNEMYRNGNIYPEIFDLFDLTTVEDSVSKYLDVISEAKQSLTIPVIASINCTSSNEWTIFAKRLEDAGADALELNVFVLPTDFGRSSSENEQVYFEIIDKVLAEVKIPISLKISYYFSNLGSMIQKLSNTGISGLVLFNRFYSPDIDVNNLDIVPASIYSHPDDLYITLRWIAIMAERVRCDLAATTGIHDSKAVIKMLLAGANAVQIASTLYKNGISYLQVILNELNEWMEKHKFTSVEQFRGKLSQAKSLNPAVYERAQFMKHFSGK